MPNCGCIIYSPIRAMRTVSPKIILFKNRSHLLLLFLVAICILYNNKDKTAETDLFLLIAQIYVLYVSFRQIHPIHNIKKVLKPTKILLLRSGVGRTTVGWIIKRRGLFNLFERPLLLAFIRFFSSFDELFHF